MSALRQHPQLGREIRAGDWPALARGTYPLLREAIADGRVEEARELARFFVVEAEVCYDIYTQWRSDALRYLADKGLDAAILAREITRIDEVVYQRRPALVAARAAAWAEVQRLRDAVIAALPDAEAADAAALRLRDLWRNLHDAEVDYISGLFDIVMRHFDEEGLGEMYHGWLIGDWFEQRYARFDVSKHSWDEAFPLIVYLTFESMHGHLSGPGREGTIAYEEHDDRIVFSFAPCGSGGRTVVGEPLDGTGPRMEPPWRFKAIERAHDWTGGKKGVCTYCAHCCVLTEKLPIERFGYPVRAVDPPLYPDGDARCTWTVYRTPDAVPEAIYARVGATKPPPGAPLGSAGAARRAELSGKA